MNATDRLKQAIDLLDLHYNSFYSVAASAKRTGHPVPCDTRGWSQILVSVLTGLEGRGRQKGSDFVDGSDVKGANTWEAIDTPRFNAVIKAGTKADTSGKLESLDSTPFLFFVLWDHSPTTKRPRCRVWCVRPREDQAFRKMCATWYAKRDAGEIQSSNFQLHPPRGRDSNEIRNECGNLGYPLLLCAERDKNGFVVVDYNPEVVTRGQCVGPIER